MKGRKNIRRLITQKELSESTQNAIKEEELRKKRIEERQQLVCILILYLKIFNVLFLIWRIFSLK